MTLFTNSRVRVCARATVCQDAADEHAAPRPRVSTEETRNEHGEMLNEGLPGAVPKLHSGASGTVASQRCPWYDHGASQHAIGLHH